MMRTYKSTTDQPSPCMPASLNPSLSVSLHACQPPYIPVYLLAFLLCLPPYLPTSLPASTTITMMETTLYSTPVTSSLTNSQQFRIVRQILLITIMEDEMGKGARVDWGWRGGEGGEGRHISYAFQSLMVIDDT